MSFQHYRDRVLMKGSTNQERITYEKKRSFDDYLKTAPTVSELMIRDVKFLASIQDVKFNDLLQEDKFLLTEIGLDIHVGDYIEWDNNSWLIKTKENESIKSQQSYRMAKCNHNLKWINTNPTTNSHTLITRPCIWSAKTLYTTGIKDEKLIQIPDGMVGIQLPYDNDTKKLQRGDEFIFNDNKYKITFINKEEYPGLLIIMCDEGEFSPSSDDMVNGIANRYNQDGIDKLATITPIEPNAGTTYTLTGSDTLKVLDGKLYTAKKFIDGIQDTTAKFNFTVSDETMGAIWEVTDTTLDLEGKNKNVGQYFTITATDRENGQSVTKQVQLVNMY